MVERSKDSEDRALEALFASEPIADDGFAKRVVRRVRRRIWVRRLALPTAVAFGALVAAKPAVVLVQSFGSTAAALSNELPVAGALGALDLPGLSTWLVAAALGIAILAFVPALDD